MVAVVIAQQYEDRFGDGVSDALEIPFKIAAIGDVSCDGEGIRLHSGDTFNESLSCSGFQKIQMPVGAPGKLADRNVELFHRLCGVTSYLFAAVTPISFISATTA